jgi:hypothetical protein
MMEKIQQFHWWKRLEQLQCLSFFSRMTKLSLLVYELRFIDSAVTNFAMLCWNREKWRTSVWRKTPEADPVPAVAALPRNAPEGALDTPPCAPDPDPIPALTPLTDLKAQTCPCFDQIIRVDFARLVQFWCFFFKHFYFIILFFGVNSGSHYWSPLCGWCNV